jgi:hypothetical protein
MPNSSKIGSAPVVELHVAGALGHEALDELLEARVLVASSMTILATSSVRRSRAVRSTMSSSVEELSAPAWRSSCGAPPPSPRS